MTLPLPEGLEFKDRYPFDCYSCGLGLYAKPSIFMEMGMNMGGGNCPRCKVMFQLKINDENTGMDCFAMSEGATRSGSC